VLVNEQSGERLWVADVGMSICLQAAVPLNYSIRVGVCYLLPYSSSFEVFLNDMRYINPRFTYLLTYIPEIRNPCIDVVGLTVAA